MNAEGEMIWWVWKNGVHRGRELFIAYDKEYPVMPDGGDPLVLGEPVFSGTGPEVRVWKPGADIDFRRARGSDRRTALNEVGLRAARPAVDARRHLGISDSGPSPVLPAGMQV
jgi:hypothetical protein